MIRRLICWHQGKCKTSRLWVYVRDDRLEDSEMPPAAWFAWSAEALKRFGELYAVEAEHRQAVCREKVFR